MYHAIPFTGTTSAHCAGIHQVDALALHHLSQMGMTKTDHINLSMQPLLHQLVQSTLYILEVSMGQEKPYTFQLYHPQIRCLPPVTVPPNQIHGHIRVKRGQLHAVPIVVSQEEDMLRPLMFHGLQHFTH
mgnify:CR=1 FL=1